MPIRAPRNPLLTQADWDRWARNVPVEPDPNSVGNDEIKDGAVVTSKLADSAVTAPKVADKAITDGKLRDSNALTVMGRSVNTNGTPADIALDANGKFLVRRSNQLVGDTIQDSDIPASIARDTEVTAAVSAHEGAADPHPQYLTQTEGDARYRELTDAVTYAEITGKPAALALLYTGTGSPETVVTAGVGSLYLRTDGGAGTTLYVKESGAGNTGWIGK
jgi:hypothetical protein